MIMGGPSPSSTETQQYPTHLSTLNLEAGSGIGPIDGDSGTDKLDISEQGRVLLVLKNYRIRRGVEYMVLESYHEKYHGKCKEFGDGCNWLIRVTNRCKKGQLEVRRYNGSYTYLAIDISSDHR
ncbi:hypothetical protein PIB30_098600 [Stylosanthes scabra]|uniref:Transposase MuDR plant domain-containing protein n=1 Tax=Stylosanthes scabra TaxID=79078 RepID=A0ABU6QWX1_9FABA|nr:hypothetical protein [Stylosanthes scabra]